MNRSSFVKKLLVFLGFSSSTNVLLSSCEKGETLLEVEEELSAEEKAYKELKENIGENGFFLDGKILNVDLTHKNYLKLNYLLLINSVNLFHKKLNIKFNNRKKRKKEKYVKVY